MRDAIDSAAQGAAIRAIGFYRRHAAGVTLAVIALCLLGLWWSGPEPL